MDMVITYTSSCTATSSCSGGKLPRICMIPKTWLSRMRGKAVKLDVTGGGELGGGRSEESRLLEEALNQPV
jgi:biotin synthase-related radical SAM superfamily protein